VVVGRALATAGRLPPNSGGRRRPARVGRVNTDYDSLKEAVDEFVQDTSEADHKEHSSRETLLDIHRLVATDPRPSHRVKSRHVALRCHTSTSPCATFYFFSGHTVAHTMALWHTPWYCGTPHGTVALAMALWHTP
jgi:hypothetical protein